jgi:hypothetical protein
MTEQRQPTLPTVSLLQGARYVPAIEHIPRSNPLWDKFKDRLPKVMPCATTGQQS